MGLYIVLVCFVYAERVKTSRIAGDIGRAWFKLLGRLVANSEATIVVRDVFVSIIATLAKSFLKTVTLVH